MSGRGLPVHSSDRRPGNALAKAGRRKITTYPEIAGRGRGRCVVLGCEVGGR